MVFEPQQKGGITPVPPQGGILQGGASKPIGSANNKKYTPTGYFFVVRISNHKRMPTAFSPGSETQVDENEHREV